MKKDSSAHEYMEECRCHGCQLMLGSGVASGEDGETIHSLHYVLRLDVQNILAQPCRRKQLAAMLLWCNLSHRSSHGGWGKWEVRACLETVNRQAEV